jgi:hypothetical protein
VAGTKFREQFGNRTRAQSVQPRDCAVEPDVG